MEAVKVSLHTRFMIGPDTKAVRADQARLEAVRRNIVGIGQGLHTPYGTVHLVYLDWTASGRLYGPIEDRLRDAFGPFVGNTHSEASATGRAMTEAYRLARDRIKAHVGAGSGDAILLCGSGMTSAVGKLQRILGLKVPEQVSGRLRLAEAERPVVFLTHMEHHSNHTTWQETIADTVVVPPDADGLVDPGRLEKALEPYRDRPLKIGAFTACSNVTGIRTPSRDLARVMHSHGGWCFVDFAASAPYDPITMRTADPEEKVDALYFSPHKFLGGPGSCGVLVFDARLYTLRVPEQPGGGTVRWTDPWGGHSFLADIEAREDGGTPAFLQAVRAALAVDLKERMGREAIHEREATLGRRLLEGLASIDGLHVLADHVRDRLGIVSFYAEDIHYNLFVTLLNDRFGVQARGGCSCAGTYGHFLLHVDPRRSRRITEKIDRGDFSEKPGWVRLSVHPTTSEAEVDHVLDAAREIARHARAWGADYRYSPATNEFTHAGGDPTARLPVEEWLRLPEP
jgi:selenocysteine lyase/cysteine desulfurase